MFGMTGACGQVASGPPAPRGRGAPAREAERRRRAGAAPVRIADLLAEALPRRVQGRLLDLEFLRGVWRDAVSPNLPEAAAPEAFDRGILTVRAEDAESARAVRRRRGEIRDRLLAAAGLPGARLRIRVVERKGAAR